MVILWKCVDVRGDKYNGVIAQIWCGHGLASAIITSEVTKIATYDTLGPYRTLGIIGVAILNWLHASNEAYLEKYCPWTR
jgi:hypothetical protein